MNELPGDTGHISILSNSETRKQETSFNQGFFHFHFVSVFNLFFFLFSDTAHFIILKLFIRVQSTYWDNIRMVTVTKQREHLVSRTLSVEHTTFLYKTFFTLCLFYFIFLQKSRLSANFCNVYLPITWPIFLFHKRETLLLQLRIRFRKIGLANKDEKLVFVAIVNCKSSSIFFFKSVRRIKM